jgi:hypothetical protein
MGCAFAWPIDETGCGWPLIAASVLVPTSPSSHKAGLGYYSSCSHDEPAGTDAALGRDSLPPGATTGPRGFQGLVGPQRSSPL